MTTEPGARCPWAIRYGVMETRCMDGAGHLGSDGKAGPHIGRGLEAYPYQWFQWFPGDRHEFTTERNDRFSWEVTPVTDEPCIFFGCLSRFRHWHAMFPGGYTNPEDPDGPPIPFTSEPEPGTRDYNGALLRGGGGGTSGVPPVTEAGKRLLESWAPEPGGPDVNEKSWDFREALHGDIAAIEFEAVAAERARIRAGVEPLLDAAMMTDDGSLDEVVDALQAILRIVDGADR